MYKVVDIYCVHCLVCFGGEFSPLVGKAFNIKNLIQENSIHIRSLSEFHQTKSKFCVLLKENVNREIAEKTAELYFEGMSYEEVFEKAKEIIKDVEEKM